MELTKRFPDDAAAEAWFIKQRWPEGVRCPRCYSQDIQTRPTRKPAPFRCRACRKDFSVKTDSRMHGSPLTTYRYEMGGDEDAQTGCTRCDYHYMGIAAECEIATLNEEEEY